jgi:hypothetical protein
MVCLDKILQIYPYLEDNITQYEQVPPDPDCTIIEEDKPLPHFHGEPVPPDDEDEDATIDDDDDMEVMMTETTTSPTDRPQRRRSGGSIGGGGNTRIKQQRLQQQIDEDPPLNEDEIQLDYSKLKTCTKEYNRFCLVFR